MIITITSNTEEAFCTLTLKVSTFKITSIQGENVSIAVSQLQAAYRRLMIAEKVPHDIADCLIDATLKAMKYKICIEKIITMITKIFCILQN